MATNTYFDNSFWPSRAWCNNLWFVLLTYTSLVSRSICRCRMAASLRRCLVLEYSSCCLVDVDYWLWGLQLSWIGTLLRGITFVGTSLRMITLNVRRSLLPGKLLGYIYIWSIGMILCRSCVDRGPSQIALYGVLIYTCSESCSTFVDRGQLTALSRLHLLMSTSSTPSSDGADVVNVDFRCEWHQVLLVFGSFHAIINGIGIEEGSATDRQRRDLCLPPRCLYDSSYCTALW